MRYGVIGTGAIGGYYGAKLAHAGHRAYKKVIEKNRPGDLYVVPLHPYFQTNSNINESLK